MKFFITYIFTLLLSLLLPSEAFAQLNPGNNFYDTYKLNGPLHYKGTEEDSNVTLLGKFKWGPCAVTESKDNFLFVANGSLIQILDIINPSVPVLITEIEGDDFIYDIKIQGDYLYSLSPLMIVDISDPLIPQKIFSGSYFGTEIILDGDYAYTGNFHEISILDISDPSQPELLSRFNIPGWTTGMDVYNSEYLYTTTGDAMYILIVDVSDKHNPLPAGTFGGGALDITIYDHYLFVPNFSIYDISNPIEPEYTGGLNMFAQISEIEIKDSLAYICGFDYGISVINISNKNYPDLILNFPWGGYSSGLLGPREITINENLLFTACWNGTWILEIESPYNLDSLSYYYTGNYCRDLVVDDKFGYTAYNTSGMIIINYENPSNPVYVSQLPVDSYVSDIEKKDDLIFLLTSTEILIVDVADKINPEIISSIEGDYSSPYTFNYSMLVTDSLIICGSDSTRIRVINYSDPFNPFIEKEFETDYMPRSLALYGDYLYSAEYYSGLNIFDISENEPQPVNNLPDESAIYILIRDGILYASRGTELRVYNLQNPIIPGFRDSLLTICCSFGVADLEISDEYIYMAYDKNTEIINISNPDSIYLSGYERNFYQTGIAVNNKFLFEANNEYGISIFRNDLITGIKNEKYTEEINNRGLDIYPTPFNSQTNISFKLNETSNVKLKVYNLLGEECRTIVEKELNRGSYNYLFDAGELASGIYIIRLETKNIIKAKKIILLR